MRKLRTYQQLKAALVAKYPGQKYFTRAQWNAIMTPAERKHRDQTTFSPNDYLSSFG